MIATLGYLRRDYLVWTSYRLAALWQLCSVFVLGAVVYFAGTAIGDNSRIIQDEQGSYVAFLLVGLAGMDLLTQAMGALASNIGESQRAGTFEAVLFAPVSVPTLALSFWTFRFLLALVRAVILIAFGYIFLGYWHSANFLTIFVVLVPATLAFFGIGEFSAAFVVLVKQGDPIRLAYAGAMAVLGGVLFPVESLPEWLQPLTFILPVTHALTGIREGLSGASPIDMAGQIAFLTSLAVVLVPTGMYTFRRALARAKREGSLGEY
jgi:ABC-2 type transport system permease protein